MNMERVEEEGHNIEVDWEEMVIKNVVDSIVNQVASMEMHGNEREVHYSVGVRVYFRRKKLEIRRCGKCEKRLARARVFAQSHAERHARRFGRLLRRDQHPQVGVQNGRREGRVPDLPRAVQTLHEGPARSPRPEKPRTPLEAPLVGDDLAGGAELQHPSARQAQLRLRHPSLSLRGVDQERRLADR